MFEVRAAASDRVEDAIGGSGESKMREGREETEKAGEHDLLYLREGLHVGCWLGEIEDLEERGV